MPISVKQRRHHHHEELHFHFLNNTVDDRRIPWYLLSEATRRRLCNYPEAIQQSLPNHCLHRFRKQQERLEAWPGRYRHRTRIVLGREKKFTGSYKKFL